LKHVKRFERPRIDGYVDWCNTRIVVAQAGQIELHWHRAGLHWVYQGAYNSHGGSLNIHYLYNTDKNGYFRKSPKKENIELHRGGRLSKSLLEKYDADISRLLNLKSDAPKVSECYNQRFTVVYEEGEFDLEEN
jgi:hypothetical protein